MSLENYEAALKKITKSLGEPGFEAVLDETVQELGGPQMVINLSNQYGLLRSDCPGDEMMKKSQ